MRLWVVVVPDSGSGILRQSEVFDIGEGEEYSSTIMVSGGARKQKGILDSRFGGLVQTFWLGIYKNDSLMRIPC